MNASEIEKVAQIYSRRVPAQWREDCAQEIYARALELQAQGVALTGANLSAIGQETVDYAYHHWVHDQHHLVISGIDYQHGEGPVSLSTLVSDGVGNTATLADVLPSPACISRVEDWALARIALASMPERIAKLSAMWLLDHRKLTKSERAGLTAWGQKMGLATS